MLNCKINSTNGGTFSNSAGTIPVNFFVWVVLFGHNYGPVNQKKTHQNFSCKVGKSTSICAIDLALQHIYF